MDAGAQATAIEVIIGGRTTMVAEADLVESSFEVAVMVAVPVAAGVNIPALVIDPTFAGLTDHVTAALKPGVPVTTGVQAVVCDIRMDAGEQATVREVIVGGRTTTVADANLVESSVEVAVMVAVPAAEAVNAPVPVTDPRLEGLTDHVTERLAAPVAFTLRLHVDV